MPRQKIYKSEAERVRAHYQRQKEAGMVNIRMAIPTQYKDIWDKFQSSHNLTQGSALCLLLDLFYDEDESDRN